MEEKESNSLSEREPAMDADSTDDVDVIEDLSEEENAWEENQPSKKKNRVRNVLLEGLIYVALILLCVFVIPKYVVQRTIVKGESMEDTLMDQDNLIVNKISFHLSDPKRFDIVVFYPYGRDKKNYYVKRVIGLPGEEVKIEEDNIYINGELLEEDFGKDPISYAGIAEEPLLLADDEYFLMGDNRSNSLDSRFNKVGPVKRDLIEGKAVLRIWPMDRFGLLH